MPIIQSAIWLHYLYSNEELWTIGKVYKVHYESSNLLAASIVNWNTDSHLQNPDLTFRFDIDLLYLRTFYTSLTYSKKHSGRTQKTFRKYVNFVISVTCYCNCWFVFCSHFFPMHHEVKRHYQPIYLVVCEEFATVDFL